MSWSFEWDSTARRASRERVAAAAAEFRDGVAGRAEQDRAARAVLAARRARERAAADILAEYRRHGLEAPEPVEVDHLAESLREIGVEPRQLPVSIELLLDLGWTVENYSGQLTLVQPAGKVRRSRHPKAEDPPEGL